MRTSIAVEEERLLLSPGLAAGVFLALQVAGFIAARSLAGMRVDIGWASLAILAPIGLANLVLAVRVLSGAFERRHALHRLWYALVGVAALLLSPVVPVLLVLSTFWGAFPGPC
jgi:hypothetical protein